MSIPSIQIISNVRELLYNFTENMNDSFFAVLNLKSKI